MTPLRTVLGNRQLARIELAWAGSSLGNWAFSILLALYAYRHGGSATVALALVVRMAPAGLAASWTAALADRHPRQAVLLWSAAVRACALAAAAACSAAGAPLGVVLACAAVFTVASTAHKPAQAALMPLLARSPAELAAANVCWSAIDYAGFLAGSLLAGAAASAGGLEVGVAACAATLTAVALVVGGVERDVRPAALPGQGTSRGELLAGLRTVREHREIRPLVGVFAIVALVQGVVDVLVVLAALRLLDMGESGAGWLNAAWGVGGLVGGAAALGLLGRGGLRSGLSAGLVLTGLPLAAVALVPAPLSAMVLLGVMGVGFVLVESTLLTLTQRLACDDVLGRVFGVQETIEVGALALGSVLAAGLVAGAGIRVALLATGLVLPLVAAATWRTRAGAAVGAPLSVRAFSLVRCHALFAPLSVAGLEEVTRGLEVRDYADGEAIVGQGEPGGEYFLLAAGRAQVSVDGRPRRVLEAGAGFGEIAALRRRPRTASVTASGAATVLVMAPGVLEGCVGAHPRSTQAADATIRGWLQDDARQRRPAPSEVPCAPEHGVAARVLVG